MKININLFFSLYRRERKDRQRNLFDLIDICNHTAHDFFIIIIIITFVYQSVYSIRWERVREWHRDTSFRSNSFLTHSWKSFFAFLSDLRFNCSNDDEHNIGKCTDWPHIYLSYQLTLKWHRDYSFFLTICPSISFSFYWSIHKSF